VKKGYLQRDPIADADSIRHVSEKGARRKRRLEPEVLDARGKVQRPGEEQRLIDGASPMMQRLIVAALETAMRKGELLKLRWVNVDFARKRIVVRAETSKTRTGREIPITGRLQAVLEMARTALDAELTQAEGDQVSTEDRQRANARACVFGDLTGKPIANTKRAFETAVLQAAGHEPKWTAVGGLSKESREALRHVNLHFHDLRHEAASRFVEAGMPIHHVQAALGHASLQQTTTYVNVMWDGLQGSFRQFDESRPRCNSVVSEGQIDHSLVYNEQRSADSKVSVN